MNAIPEFAKGGLPEPGEFFMCRGEGAPEMVGKLNNYATWRNLQLSYCREHKHL